MKPRFAFLAPALLSLLAGPAWAESLPLEGESMKIKELHARWSELQGQRVTLSGPLDLYVREHGVRVLIDGGKPPWEGLLVNLNPKLGRRYFLDVPLRAFAPEARRRLLDHCGPRFGDEVQYCRAETLELTLPWSYEADDITDISLAWQEPLPPAVPLPEPLLAFLLDPRSFLHREVVLPLDRVTLSYGGVLLLVKGDFRLPIYARQRPPEVFLRAARFCHLAREPIPACAAREVRFRLTGLPSESESGSYNVEELAIVWEEPWSPPAQPDPDPSGGPGPRPLDGYGLLSEGQNLIGQTRRLVGDMAILTGEAVEVRSAEEGSRPIRLQRKDFGPDDLARLLRFCLPEHQGRFTPEHCAFRQITLSIEGLQEDWFELWAEGAVEIVWQSALPPLAEAPVADAGDLPLIDIPLLMADPARYSGRRVRLLADALLRVEGKTAVALAGSKDWAFPLAKRARITEDDEKRIRRCLRSAGEACGLLWIEAEVIDLGGRSVELLPRWIELGGELRFGWKNP